MEEQRRRPNPYLMWERLQRGWSQQESAHQLKHLMETKGETQVGVDRHMWHRWETGKRKPDPRYKKYLVILFEKRAAQLGLIGEEDLTTLRTLLGYSSWEQLLLKAIDPERGGVGRRAFLSQLATLASIPALAPLQSMLSDEEPWERLSLALERPRPLDAGTAAHFETITGQYRSLYWTTPAPSLLHSVSDHTWLGIELLRTTQWSPAREGLAASVAEAALLTGRLAFFDMQLPRVARRCYELAMLAAKEAANHALAAAIMAHMSFIPGFAGKETEARDCLRAARRFAAKEASAQTRAWLDCVVAEVAVNIGDTEWSLSALGRAECLLGEGELEPDPPWLDWFSPARFDSFRGYCLLKVGKLEEAQAALDAALATLPTSSAAKQQAVVLADLADVHVQLHNIDEACRLLSKSLEILEMTSYATASDRVHRVRRLLEPWESDRTVRDFDDRLDAWRLGPQAGPMQTAF